MKDTTQSIYDLVTSERFENIIGSLKEVVENYSWEDTVHQEFTYEDLLNILPQCINVIKTTIEDNNVFENQVIYTDRNTIYGSLTGIDSGLSNMESGRAQLPSVMSNTEIIYSLIVKNRLDYKTEHIPLYNEKINEYKDLNERLRALVKGLEETETNQNDYNSLIDKINKTIESLTEYETNAEKSYEKVSANDTAIETLKENSEEKLESITQTETNANTSYEEITTIEENSNKFFEKVEEHITKMNTSEEETQNIITKNNEQTAEIDKQLEKAVGVSLFHTFSKRRENLEPTTWGWLGIIIVAVGIMVYLSSDIVNGFNAMNHISEVAAQTTDKNVKDTVVAAAQIPSNDINWIWLTLKITLTFPLIYLIAFATTRYAKERRLMEEYAFKSSVSLALKPYSDLVIKLGKEGNDQEHRKFLIDTINDIFSTPTDKVFGSNEKNIDMNNFDLKGLNTLVDSLNKLKK